MTSVDRDRVTQVESENDRQVTIGEYVNLRESSLEVTFYKELQSRGIPDDLAYKIVRKSFLAHRENWEYDQTDEMKAALSQTKIPLQKRRVDQEPKGPSASGK